MELEASYKLLGVVRDDGIRTYRAIEIASGQAMQVHLFADPGSEPDRALFRALRTLPLSKRRELLEIGMEGDMPYVVTEKLPAGSTAREWLTKLAGVAPKAPGAVFLAGSWKTGTPIPDELLRASRSSTPPVPPATKKQAEFSADYTRVMRVPQAFSGLPPGPEPGTPQLTDNRPEVPAIQPGEVNQKPPSIQPTEPPPVAASQTREASIESRSSSPPTEPQPVAASQTREASIGSQSSSPPTEPPPIAAPSLPEEPDEFARLFGDMPAAKSPILPSQPPAVAPATPQHEPGEFTRMFLAAQPPKATPRAAPAAQPTVEFSSQFPTARQTEPAQPPAPPQTFPPPHPVTPPKQPPGEFTSMFLAAQPPEPAPPLIRPTPAAPLTQGAPPGEFTSMFLASQLAPATVPATPEEPRLYQAVQPPAPPPRLKSDTPPAVQPPPVTPSSEEATRLFQAITPSTPPPGPTSQPKGGTESGEFARMFPPVEPPGSPMGLGMGPGGGQDRPPTENPSEFTRFFQSPMYPAPAGNQRAASPAATPQPAARPSAQPGEFTQMFGNPGKSSTAPPPPLGSGNASSATGVFSVPKSASPGASAKGPNYGTPNPGAAKPAASPGEFTRMMSASAAPTLGQPPTPLNMPSNEPTTKSKSNLPLYVAGGAVLLAIILIAMFFALRH